MELTKLIKGIDCKVVNYKDIDVSHITFDSRNVGRGSLFVAQTGVHTDGHIYIDSVIEKGAAVIVCEVLPENLHSEVVYIQVLSSSNALGLIA